MILFDFDQVNRYCSHGISTLAPKILRKVVVDLPWYVWRFHAHWVAGISGIDMQGRQSILIIDRLPYLIG